MRGSRGRWREPLVVEWRVARGFTRSEGRQEAKRG